MSKTSTAPAVTIQASTKIPGLPDPGPGRQFVGQHNPNNVKFPMVLELRESMLDDGRPFKINFSRLIAKQPVIADPKVIAAAAEDILVRAARVDEFVGVIVKEV